METVYKSKDGKVIVTKRAAGHAVSVRVATWSVEAKAFIYSWQTLVTGLTYMQAGGYVVEMQMENIAA